jgi:hypothetical protein
MAGPAAPPFWQEWWTARLGRVNQRVAEIR